MGIGQRREPTYAERAEQLDALVVAAPVADRPVPADFGLRCTPERFRANTLANLALALHSLRSLQEIGAETGIAYDRATNGVLKIYRSRDSLDAATRGCEFLAGHGLLFERLDVAGCVAHEPALADVGTSLAGGLYFPRDEVGDCNKFTQGLAAACAARGATYHYATAVQRLETTGGRVTGVVTDKGRFAADRVVVAMGSFTGPLLRAAGVDVPIYPVKGCLDHLPARRLERRAADAGDRRQQAVRPGADRRPDAHLRLGRDHRLRHHAGRCRGARPSSPMPLRPSPNWRATSTSQGARSGPDCGR